ncbi:MAG: hypothetical protein ACLFR1_05975 [Spirochaetia bacterium]
MKKNVQRISVFFCIQLLFSTVVFVSCASLEYAEEGDESTLPETPVFSSSPQPTQTMIISRDLHLPQLPIPSSPSYLSPGLPDTSDEVFLAEPVLPAGPIEQSRDWTDESEPVQERDTAAEENQTVETASTFQQETSEQAQPVYQDAPANEPSSQASPQTRESSDAAASAGEAEESAQVEQSQPEVLEEAEVREVFAKPGDRVAISFEQPGWIYLGEEPVEDAGLEYQGRELSTQSTIFEFTVSELGEHVLNFQRQDLSQGTIHPAQVRLSVVPEQEIEARMLGIQSSSEGEGESNVDIARADSLIQEGQLGEAYEYLTMFEDEQEPEVLLRLAQTASALGEYRESLDHWRSLQEEEDYTEQAVSGIAEAAMHLEDEQELSDALQFLEDLGAERLEDLLVSAGVFFEDQGNVPQAQSLLEQWLTSYEGNDNTDYVIYRLARLYEGQSDVRNIRRSLALYQKLVDEYPISQYWDTASQRVRYLQRHYFYIR